jgi:fumarylacetoacetase
MRRCGIGPHRLSTANLSTLYWTPAQLVAHHVAGGCALNAGDLLGSGTISPESPDGAGCLLELSSDGRRPLILANGETRTYLEDGDQVIFRASCNADGYATIGFGDCIGTVRAAQAHI